MTVAETRAKHHAHDLGATAPRPPGSAGGWPGGRVAAGALTAGTVAWLGWLWLGMPEVSWAVATSSVAVIAAAFAGVVLDPHRHARAHAMVVASLLLLIGGFAALSVVDHWPFAWNALPDRRYAALIAVVSVVASYGVVRGTAWGRWMAMAFAATVALGGALNTIGMRASRDEFGFEAAIGVLGGLAVLARLLAPSVRAWASSAAPLWTSRDRLVRSARWAAISAFAASPMLVLYALCQPVAPATVVTALVLAPFLALGGTLVVARRAAGLLVLAVTGLALAAQTLATLVLVPADSLGLAGYYACFWTPAALLGVVAGSLAIWRARR